MLGTLLAPSPPFPTIHHIAGAGTSTLALQGLFRGPHLGHCQRLHLDNKMWDNSNLKGRNGCNRAPFLAFATVSATDLDDVPAVSTQVVIIS
jgi:hypothetical protein